MGLVAEAWCGSGPWQRCWWPGTQTTNHEGVKVWIGLSAPESGSEEWSLEMKADFLTDLMWERTRGWRTGSPLGYRHPGDGLVMEPSVVHNLHPDYLCPRFAVTRSGCADEGAVSLLLRSNI